MRYACDVHVDEYILRKQMAEDVLAGLTRTPKALPPKYFYDARGSELFERITRLPEYYQTRVEDGLLASFAPGLIDELSPAEIVEVGSGSSRKTRRLLEPLRRHHRPIRYIPVDVDRTMVESAATTLLRDFAFLSVHALVGDFERHLAYLPPAAGRRLLAFLGSTIGNLEPHARHDFLEHARGLLHGGDRLVLGVDLVKDRRSLELAYNDSAGVTAQFNLNILRVVNRALDANFALDAYRHYACYNEDEERIEMHLVPEREQHVRVKALALDLSVAPGESICTEHSYKFTRTSARDMLVRAGFTLERWFTDAGARFALVVAGVE